MKLIRPLLLLFCSVTAAAAAAGFDPAKQAVFQASTFLQRDAYFKSEDYVFDYDPASKSKIGLRVSQKYGDAVFMQLPQTPALIGTNLGSARFDFRPCAVLHPHVHRVDAQVYVLQGKIRGGFVLQSFGKLVEVTLNPGQGMLVPRGAFMFFENLSHENNASFIASFSGNDFGVDLIVPLLFYTLPSDITQAAMGLSEQEYQKFKATLHDNQIYAVNQQCLKRMKQRSYDFDDDDE